MTALSQFTSPRVGGRGRGPRGGVSRALRPRLAACLVAALALSACVATQRADVVQANAPGFLEGLWHGFIFPVAWIISLFTDTVAIYEQRAEGLRPGHVPWAPAAQRNRARLASSLASWAATMPGEIVSAESELVDGVRRDGFSDTAAPL